MQGKYKVYGLITREFLRLRMHSTFSGYYFYMNKNILGAFQIYISVPWVHPFGTYAKFFEKLAFLTPWYVHVRVRIKGWKMLVFAYVLNGWPPLRLAWHDWNIIISCMKFWNVLFCCTEAYSEPNQTSKMELFARQLFSQKAAPP